MMIKGLTKTQLKKRLNYLEKTRPNSRWIKYIKYQLRQNWNQLWWRYGGNLPAPQSLRA